METTQSRAVLAISLLAAMADGAKDDREREQIKQIAATLAGADTSLAGVYQDVLLGRVTLASASAALTDPGLRQYAFEMAVSVCDADGARSERERTFLDGLRASLGIDAGSAARYADEADAVAAMPVAVPAAIEPPPVKPQAAANDAELDAMILNYAILNGALELLPQNLASMAIIPLQMKMVYRVGRQYGFELDRGHIKDFLATAGAGLASQYVEQFGRKLLGGLLGQVAGGLGRGVGSAVAGGAFSFATTYALGQLAKRYYAGGRTFSTQMLKSTYEDLLGQGKTLQERYLPQIRQKAGTLDVAQVLQAARQ
jgi:uncharacterized protein (DUF697 family)/tellurite resistance protein